MSAGAYYALVHGGDEDGGCYLFVAIEDIIMTSCACPQLLAAIALKAGQGSCTEKVRRSQGQAPPVGECVRGYPATPAHCQAKTRTAPEPAVIQHPPKHWQRP